MSEWRLKLYRGRYAAVRSVGGRTERVSLRTSDLSEARRRLIDYESRPVGETVGDLVAAYLTDKDKTAIRAADLRTAWKAASPTFAHLRPDQVTRDLCRRYRDQRYAAGRKPNTVRKELEVVRAALNFHKVSGAVFELPKPPPPKDRYLSREEARRLMRAARPFPHVRAFIALSLATGARQTALLDLTWDRVDMQRGLIALSIGDTQDDIRKRRATVPMNRRARRYLKVLRAASTCNHVIEWAGHRVFSVKKGFAAARKRAGLGPDVTPHILRHTAASWMAESGVDMFRISRYLGHSDTKVTERRYAKLHPDYLADAAKALDF